MMSRVRFIMEKINKFSPRKRKAILICLWILAPIEMAIITGIYKGYKRVQDKA